MNYNNTQNVPNLPDELYHYISQLTCEESKTFLLQWVKQRHILQIVIYLDPTNVKDAVHMDTIAKLFREELASHLSDAMPFSIDKVNGPAQNFCLRVAQNKFVAALTNDAIHCISETMTHKMAKVLGFIIEKERRTHIIDINTFIVTYSVCRHHTRKIVAKAWK